METLNDRLDQADTHGPDERPSRSERQTWYTIRDLSKEFDVTMRALRFYEDKGLLSPYRDGPSRLYSRRDRARLKLILLGKRIGLSLMEIGKLLDAYSRKDRGRRQMKLAYGMFQKQIDLLEDQRQEIDSALGELKDHVDCMRRHVDT